MSNPPMDLDVVSVQEPEPAHPLPCLCRELMEGIAKCWSYVTCRNSSTTEEAYEMRTFRAEAVRIPESQIGSGSTCSGGEDRAPPKSIISSPSGSSDEFCKYLQRVVHQGAPVYFTYKGQIIGEGNNCEGFETYLNRLVTRGAPVYFTYKEEARVSCEGGERVLPQSLQVCERKSNQTQSIYFEDYFYDTSSFSSQHEEHASSTSAIDEVPKRFAPSATF